MKKNISLFLAIVNLLALFCMPVQAADVDVSQYGSATYTTAYYVPSGSGHSSIAYEQSGDGTETGGYVLTYSKASSATSVPADTLITGAGGGLGNVKIANDKYGAKTFHSRYTFVESSSPILLQFQHKNSSDAVTLKNTFTMTNEGVSFDGAYVAATAPYDVNIFQNVYTGETVIYVNDTVLIDQRGTGETLIADGATYWHKLNFITTQDDSAFGLVLKNIRHMVYTTDVTLSDVVGYVMNDSGSGDEVDPPVDSEEPGDDEIYDGVTGDGEGVVKDVSEYGASTYTANYYVPGSSGAADYVNWSDTGSQAEGGEHIQTAVLKSGVASVPAGQNAINVGGALGNVKLKNNDSYGAKTLHCRYTFVESSSPILMRFQYQTSSNGGSPKDTFTMTNTGVTFGDASVSATAPYDINIFQNVDSGVTVIYVNDEILYDARKTGNNLWGSGSHHWQQFRFRTTQADSAFKLVIKNMHHEVYDEKVLLSDVIDYVMLDNKDNAKKTNYWWTIDGIKTEWKEIQGAMDGICSITGNNTDGYVLAPNSINESHYGYARYFLGSDDKDPLYTSTDDSVLWQTFEYNPTKLTQGQIFEIRGNNAYQTLITAVPATETEGAYLSIGNNKVAIEADKFYKIDFIVNNKDYEYYILVDGKIVNHSTIWETRQPLWQTVFSSYTEEESMTLKNVKTTLFDSTVSINDIMMQLATNVYTDVSEFIYDQDLKTLTVTATVIGSETVFESADLIYAAYTQEGNLVATDVVETYSEDVTNVTEYETNYPHGELDVADVAEGEELIIKAYLWDSVSGMTPISNAGQGTYTVPVTVVEG